MNTLNYFQEISLHYPAYLTANRAVALLRKITPIEHPVEPLYALLGGYLQHLTSSQHPQMSWPPFEIKVLQEAGLFSVNLIRRKLAEQSIRLTEPELAFIELFLASGHQRWIFSRPPEEVAILTQCEPILRQIREDYHLSRLPTKASGIPRPASGIPRIRGAGCRTRCAGQAIRGAGCRCAPRMRGTRHAV